MYTRFAVGLVSMLCLVPAFADPPAANPPTPAAATTPASTAAAAPAAVDPDVKHFMAEGYKPEMRQGQQMYCRKETAIGSRLTPVKTCGTIEDLKIQEQRAQAGVEQGQRQQTQGPSSK